MPIKNGRLILQREVSDFAERFTVDPANLLSVGTFVRLATSGDYEIAVQQVHPTTKHLVLSIH